MVFTSLRRFLMRYAEASRSRRLSHQSASLKKHRGLSLAAYWGRRWAFEQLEARLVPSTLTANKTAYAPTDPAILTGSGFQVGETVDLSVVRGDGTPYTAWKVTDDANGNLVTNWSVPMDAPGNSFTATATGETSGDSATAAFTGLATWVYTLPTDYQPGQTANIFAGGFTVGEAVDFQVTNLANGNVYPGWSVTDGSGSDLDGATDGHVQTGWVVPSDAVNATLQVTAAGEASGLTAVNTFTDSASLTTSSSPSSFSPNNDGIQDTTTITYSLGGSDSSQTITLVIKNSSNVTVRTLVNAVSQTKNGSPSSVIWDGKNDSATVVPDGAYTAVVSSPTGGSQSSSLTVDTVAPTAGTVNDGAGADINFQSSTTTVSANWSGFSDSGSGIASYSWAIGTTPGGTNILAFTNIGNVTSRTQTGLTLTNGTTYYVSVKATDNAGNVSSVATSNGVTVDSVAPTTASVTTPASGSSFRAANVPATFSGSAADNTGGSGLNANSTTFTLQRSSDSRYWTGTTWQTGAFALAATNSATTGNTVVTWTNSATLPTWASQVDATYTVQATATDKAGNTFTGTAVTFTLDNTAPTAASVTTPANGSAFQTAAVPANFSGSVADNSSGVGLNANSTTFTLLRGSDSNYWNGSAWQAGVFNLAATNSATTGNTSVTWTSNATLPTWASQTDGTYTVQATATDKDSNTFTGAAAIFTLDSVAPTTASVTAPVSGTFYRAATVPAPSGSAADNTGGSGLNANSTTFTLQRGSDNFYWNSSTSAWQSGVFNLATTHSATTSNTAVTWTSNATLPTWSAQSDGTYTVQATATDKAGNTFTGTAVTFTLDNTAPTAAITYSPSGPVKQGTTLTITATFSEPMADSPVVRFTISGANTMAATNMTKVDSTHYTGTHIVGAGNGTANVALSVGTDLAGNLITATPTSGASFTVDNTAPTAALSYSPTGAVKAGTTLTITATFSEPMADSPGVQFAISGVNSMAANNMTKVDSTHYTGTHIVGAGDGTATVALSVGRDLAGNVITPTPTSGASFTVDNTAPTVAISAPSATITDSAAVTYTVTYADANFNSSTLAPGNITLNGTGTANASIAVTTVNATTRTVTLSSITGDGTLGISIAAGTATDTAGNSAPAAGPSTTFTVDNTAPATASVTAPVDGSTVQAAGVPATFSGSAADNAGGVGLNVNSTTFTLQRGSDSFYWNGTTWQAGVFNLATTHSATTGSTAATWTDNVALPTWSIQSAGTYIVQVKATDKAGNTFAGSAVSLTLLVPISPTTIGTQENHNGGTSLSQTATVSVGNTIFVEIATDQTSGTITVSDSAGNSYTKDADVANDGNIRTLVFSAPVTHALASGTITVSLPSATNGTGASFFSFDGLVSPSPKDQAHTNTGNDGTSAAPVNSGNTATTSQADELLVGALGVDSNGVTFSSFDGSFAAVPSGFIQSDGILALQPTYRVVNSTGAYSAGGTENKTAPWAADIVTYKIAAPTVSSIVRADTNPTSASSIHFTVTFSENVYGVDASDFALATSGVSGAAITGVSGSGTTYTVTASTGNGNGSIGLNLVDDDSITDLNTIPLGGTGAGNGNFTGQVYTVSKTASTSTTVASSINPSTYGQSLTFTATVTNTSGFGGTPSGTVQFVVDGSNFGSPVTLDGTGHATSGSIATLSAVSHTITANFTDGVNFGASNGSVTQTVNKAHLTVSADNKSKTYGDANPSLTSTLSGFVNGDTASAVSGAPTLSTAAAQFSAVGGYTITVVDAGNLTAANYDFPSANFVNGTLTINARTLHVTATGVNKVYDGTTTAAVTLSDDRVNNDSFTENYTSASFTDKNVGTGKTVSVSGISISGGASGNYTLASTTAGTTANITARALTVSATASNKVYDGNTTATVSLSDDRVSGDLFTDSFTSATFANKNVGNGKTVTVSGISISGTDASNYMLASTTATTTANITARALTLTATGVDKVYDGTTSATVTLSDNRVSGDVFTDSYTTATFANKNVGTSKTVSVSGISISGTDAGNYTFNTTATATANITARALTVSATGVDKVYDGTTTATVTLSDDKVSGDDVVDHYASAAFDTKNVGTGKTVTVSGITITGADAGNYTFNSSTTTTADITARALTVTATGANKVYDGTTAATVSLSDNKVSGDAVIDSYTSAAFTDKNVGMGKTVNVSGITISGADAGNYALQNATATTTANITQRDLTVSAHGVDKVYDGGTAATVTFTTDALAGDTVTASDSASFADKNAGMGKTVTVTGIFISGADACNYHLTNTTATTTANVTPRALTISATGVNKVYDGATTATVTLSDNRVAGDSFTDTYASASFADKNVGTGKAVSVSGLSISGTDAGNYTFNATASTTADITKRTLHITATAYNKVYDGTNTAVAHLSDDRVAGDVFADTYSTAVFPDKNVGMGKTVTVSGIAIAGIDAGNYCFNTTTTTTADITARTLHVSATGINKVYDGTTTATVTLSDDKVVGDDVVDHYASAAFDTKNVGTGKTVTVSGITITGADAGNYTFNSSTTTTADITPRALLVTAHGINKIYDGSTTAMVTLTDNRVSGDVFTDSYTSATFADKNVGTGKTVSVSGIAISGTDAGNYTTNTTATTTANITPRALTVSAHGVNKVYDGTTTATVTFSDDRVAGDVLTASDTATFADKNVGTGKTVSVSGIAISGTDAANYTANTTATTTADITPRALTVSAHGVDKVYDGTTTATVTLTDERVAGDVFTGSYASATFADKNVGTGKTVSVSGIAISGTDAGNYTFNTMASTTANITARPLTVSATGVNRVYDSTTTATVSLADNKVAGDAVTDSYTSASFANKNVGTGKAVSVSGIAISGADAGNYALQNTTASTTADISKRDLTVSAHGIDKVYDGGTVATVTFTTDALAGDSATANDSASFADKNVGMGKTVTVINISISGADAGNYHLTNTTASTTANITPRGLTVSAAGVSKVYDGTTSATVTLSDNRIAGDSFTDSYTSAAFMDRNVGAGKTVNVSGIATSGSDAGNYTFNTTASTTADITKRTLHVTATADSKVYDGNTTAAAHLTDDRVSGDVLSDSYTSATFNNKNVGNGKPVTVSGISISGSDAGNYCFNTATSTTANITARVLSVSATGINKVYDSTTNASVALSDDRVSGDVFTDSYTGASFADKNVSTNKPVSVSGISVSGTDAGNYSFNTTASTTANITKATLLVSAAGINRVYDATANATVTLSDNHIGTDDVVDHYTSASFTDKNVATGKAVSVNGISISGGDAGNYCFNTTATTTANITPRDLTVSAHGIDKVYDGNTAAMVTFTTDALTGDTVTATDSASFVDKNVGTNKAVNVSSISISGADAGNYHLANTTAATTANITARALTVSATGVNKVYDGATTATVTLADNKVSGDSVTDSYASASFADKNVGTGKAVSVSGISISGTDAGNYTFNMTAGTTANITARCLTVSATGVNKVYDGTTAGTVTLSDNRVSGDLFSDRYSSATFNNKNVGTAKAVSVSGIAISGADAGNYSFNTNTSTSADISARALTVSATGGSKVYDGTTTATVTLSDNRVSGDVFTDSYTSAGFADKNVASNKAVSVSGISISGSDAGNYTANTTASTTANITARALIVSATASNKTYDGNTAATVTLSDNRVAGDVFSDSYTTATFADKNVGTGKTVSVSGISISGTDAGNYTFNSTASTTATITARALTVSAAGVDKTYDATATATVTLSDNKVSGDTVTDSYTSASFANKNVGTGKTVSVSGISISGADAANYSLQNTTASTTANITARTLIVSATASNKTYDGTTAATVTLSDNRVAGDVLSDSYTTAAFADKNVGTGKTVTVNGISISGTDAGNYTANSTATTTANITAKALTVTANNLSKAEGTTLTFAGTEFTASGLVSGDTVASVTLASAGTVATVAVGTYAIVPSAAVGTGLSNYTIAYNNGTLTVINVAPTVTITTPSLTGQAFAINTAVNFAGSFTDPGSTTGETYTATWTFDGVAKTGTVSGTSVTTSYTFTTTGVIDVTLKVTDSNGGSGTANTDANGSTMRLVIYDPNAGFVTAGGTINTPNTPTVSIGSAWAMQNNISTTVTGKTNFGLVSQYKKGNSVPTGETEFQFQAGSINFHASSYDWLTINAVVNDAWSQYQGTGTINNLNPANTADVYKFYVDSEDGGWNGGTSPDKFRMKIWEQNKSTGALAGLGVIYDNQWGAADTAGEPGITPFVDLATTLTSGDIVLHKLNAAQATGMAPAGNGSAQPLTAQQLAPIVQQAIAAWSATGIGAEQIDFLRSVPVYIINLPGSFVGMSSPDGIWIDQDAAGYGWFVDATPAANGEFDKPLAGNKFAATPSSPAYGKMDLLTVIEHEMGRPLGLQESPSAAGIMAVNFQHGVRILPAASDLGRPGVELASAPNPLVLPGVQQVNSAPGLAVHAAPGATILAVDLAFIAGSSLGSVNSLMINAVPSGSTAQSAPAAASLAVWTGQPAQPASEKLSGKINAPPQHDSMDFVWARFEGLSLDDGLVNLVAQGRGR